MQREIIVDNFAGGGGASTGIERALGVPVDVAVNHNPEALAMHLANHPQTKHFCQNICALDPRDATQGRPVGLAWFSPDCKHFSKAKGGAPVEKRIRDLAWVVVHWAQLVKPRIICLENVEEFQGWGPLVDGRPCPESRGLEFRRWVRDLRKAGYVVEWRELRACDYGTPTIRKRLFLIARRDGRPIVWPSPTHGPGLLPYRTAAEVIDWDIPCPLILDRQKPLVVSTLNKIERAVTRYGDDDAFLMAYYGSDQAPQLSNPLPTCTSHDRFALVRRGPDGMGMRMLTPRELFRAQGFPEEYVINPIYKGKPLTRTAQVRCCGNSVCPPVARELVRCNFNEAKESKRLPMAVGGLFE